MKRIINYHKMELRCFNCGETRSVKYTFGGFHYCNACIIGIEGKEKFESEMKKESL